MVSRERRTYAAPTDTEYARGADKSSMDVAAERRASGWAVLQITVMAENDQQLCGRDHASVAHRHHPAEHSKLI
jgi:hypothetical protein